MISRYLCIQQRICFCQVPCIVHVSQSVQMTKFWIIFMQYKLFIFIQYKLYLKKYNLDLNPTFMRSFLTRTNSWFSTVYSSSSSRIKFSLIWNLPNHVIFELMKCVIIWTFQNLGSERFLANITTLWMFILDFVLYPVIEIL